MVAGTLYLLVNLVIDVAGDHTTSRYYVSDTLKGAGDKYHLTPSKMSEYYDRWRMARRAKLNHAHIGPIEVPSLD